MECEVCGLEEGEIVAQIEGARLHVCHKCAGLGKVLYQPQQHSQRQQAQKPLAQYEVVEEYDARIKNALRNMGLSVGVLAERINEKSSFLERVAAGHAKPTELLARKLEKELGIKLLEEAGVQQGAPTTSKSAGITLGDILEIDRKKKK
ncbi:TIGR00270 family protein [Candidatus Micrarchaeota archaeon]|nr:TIGR00270 family protein [Candidatus Micrarchaeota archaeon]